MDVGTHSGGIGYTGSRSARGPFESKRNMSKAPMMLSVVELLVISTAAGDESTGGDGYACPDCENDVGPVDPFASPRENAEVVLHVGSGVGSGSSKCFAYSEGEYSLTWSSWGV